MEQRIKNIYAKLEKESLDGLILSSPANISYLAKFDSHDAYLIISKKENIYITDSRYVEAAKKNLKGFTLKKSEGDVFRLIVETCQYLGLKRIGFEERHFTFGEYKKIKEILNKTIDLIPTCNFVEEFRAIKTPQELAKIKKAVEIAIASHKFVRNFIKPGITELKVAAELERFIRYQGASASSFDIIIASGPNSSFPHHRTCQRKIKKNEPVLVDLGADYLGYKSDLTRVYFLGKITPAIRRIYDIVLSAQERAIKKIKPGIDINKIDAAARQYITRKGYGGFFGHNLGHGIGLEIHEEPHISRQENNKLKRAMVFTVEPAIYLPGKFGVRLEDMVLVTNKGAQVLSGALDK